MNQRFARWALIAFATSAVLHLGGAAAAAEAWSTTASIAGQPGSYTVTLITGDRVQLDVAPDATQAATVEPAARDGLPVSFDIIEAAGDLYVIPSDASLYLDAQLDRQLFNVTQLVAQGLDDARSESLPVIVDYEDAVRSLPPALDGVDTLQSIDAVAAREARSKAASFGRALAEQALEDSRRGGPATRAPTGDSGLFAGIERIWLDATVEVALDESVPQIGAPAAWANGYDGTGVTVAVLDTGIDATHPDLAGKIVASQSFVPGESVADGHGHGTHVASIVAGTGPQYRGVAPGAQLVIGKAL